MMVDPTTAQVEDPSDPSMDDHSDSLPDRSYASPTNPTNQGEENDDDDDDDDEEEEYEAAIHETSQWLEPAREDGLTLYDIHRLPRSFVPPHLHDGGRRGASGWNDGASPSTAAAAPGTTLMMMRRPIRLVRSEFRCAICLETIRDARTVMECLHRFCANCLEESIRRNYKHCPVCRSLIPNRRCLAPDPTFDALVQMLLGPAATTAATTATALAVPTDADAWSRAASGSASPSARTSPSDLGEANEESSPAGEAQGADSEAVCTLQHAIHHKRLQQIHQGRASASAAASSAAATTTTTTTARNPADDELGGGSHSTQHHRPSAATGRLVTIELHRHPDETKLADLVLPHLRVSEGARVRVIDTFLKHKLGLVKAAAVAVPPDGKAGRVSEATGLLLYVSAAGSKKRRLTDAEKAAGRLLHLTERKKDALTLKDARERYRVKGTLQMFYKRAKP